MHKMQYLVLPPSLFWRVVHQRTVFMPWIEVRMSTLIGQPMVRYHST